MFELRRQGFIARHRRPAICQNLGLVFAQVHHRLDGKEHAFLQHGARARAAIMQHVWRGVEHAAQAVAAEIAHNRHTLRLDIGLDRMADIAIGIAGFGLCKADHQRLMRDIDQTLGFA
ncbi:hypothetical protein KVU_0049 [Ketogulonicigenium vulgare WSH-001]|uniref:Uncharacterized protein n=1 Tax=Ketogulonicigenium vulgare (strain WSH-001) TaxID=759362 RepID=F9Y7S2_KETVW|nr:hypothetical protein KVU_0049 [Ketogulonicigenium vulgare WSH-001]